MPTKPRTTVLNRLHHLVAAWSSEQLTDGQLLEAYVNCHDPDAFTALVRRHGPMVLNVCRGVLHNDHDAEDAFQATFLLLARKAASIRKLPSVGGWLYKVSRNVALKARLARRAPERQVAAVPSSDPAAVLARQELCEALAEELQQLPDRYRLPLILCHLENQTTNEAAQHLRCPVGTIKVRLMRGRELLRKRLNRRGFTLSAVGLTSLLLVRSAGAAVPATLLRAMARMAALTVAGKGASLAGVSAQVAQLAQAAAPAARFTGVRGLATGLLFLSLLAAGGLAQRLAVANPTSVTPAAACVPTTPEAVPDPPPRRVPVPAGAHTAFQQDNPVRFVTVSPDGKLLAVLGTNGQLQVWNVASGKDTCRFQAFDPAAFFAKTRKHSHPPQAYWLPDIVFLSDRTLAGWGWDAASESVDFTLWDPGNGNAKTRLHADTCFALSPDGKTLATDREHNVVLWEFATGRERGTLEVWTRPAPEPSRRRSLAFSADGRTVAAAEVDGTIQIWDLAERKRLRSFRVPVSGPMPKPHEGLRFSPDGGLVTAGGSWDGTLALWDVGTGKEVRQLAVADGLIHSVVFSPDGKLLAAAARDESVRVLDTATGKTIKTIPRPHGDAGITSLNFTPDGKSILTGGTDGRACFWPLP